MERLEELSVGESQDRVLSSMIAACHDSLLSKEPPTPRPSTGPGAAVFCARYPQHSVFSTAHHRADCQLGHHALRMLRRRSLSSRCVVRAASTVHVTSESHSRIVAPECPAAPLVHAIARPPPTALISSATAVSSASAAVSSASAAVSSASAAVAFASILDEAPPYLSRPHSHPQSITPLHPPHPIVALA